MPGLFFPYYFTVEVFHGIVSLCFERFPTVVPGIFSYFERFSPLSSRSSSCVFPDTLFVVFLFFVVNVSRGVLVVVRTKKCIR